MLLASHIDIIWDCLTDNDCVYSFIIWCFWRYIYQVKLMFCLDLTTYLGLLATAIIKMDGVGGLAGWRWIFVCMH